MRPRWAPLRPFAIVAVAVAVLVLGVVGFQQAKPTYSFWDSLYGSIQLFGLAGGVPPSPPTTLNIARFLGPLLVGYAAIRGLVILFRQQLQTASLRLRMRDHLVIAGLGDVGYRVAMLFHGLGAPMVVIEANPANPHVFSCRAKGITVLIGNAADKALLQRTRIHRAAYLVTSCGHDAIDLEVVHAARKALLQTKRRHLPTFVHLDDARLWRTIRTSTVAVAAQDPIWLEPFNMIESGTSLLFESTNPFDGSDSAKIVIAGDVEMARSLAIQATRVWLNASKAPSNLSIDLIGPAANGAAAALGVAHPELNRLINLRILEAEVEAQADELMRAATHAYVGFWDEADGLAAALVLRARAGGSGVPVTLVIRDSDSAVASVARRAGLEEFGIYTWGLGHDFLDRGTNEIVARAKHEHYVDAELAKGGKLGDWPSLRHWEDGLAEHFKDSNRFAAAGVARVLDRADYAVVPAPLAPIRDLIESPFTPDELDVLAEAEHRRWMEDLIENGWTLGTRDDANKVHPDLIPYARLTPDAKQKDRDSVLALPEVLRRAGFAIEKVERRPVTSDEEPLAPNTMG